MILGYINKTDLFFNLTELFFSLQLFSEMYLLKTQSSSLFLLLSTSLPYLRPPWWT